MTSRSQLTAAAPGLLLVAALALVAYASTLVLPDIFGAVTVGLFLGIIVANVRPLPRMALGARLAKAWFLPLGILLLGARLSLGDILSTGLGAVVVLVIDVILVLAMTLLVGRALGLPDRLAALIGVGTGYLRQHRHRGHGAGHRGRGARRLVRRRHHHPLRHGRGRGLSHSSATPWACQTISSGTGSARPSTTPAK